MDRFEGFADADARFFKALAKHQDREWFAKHKGEFEEGWNTPMKALLAELHGAIDGAYPHCDLDEPKVFRIFRDVRFAKDKSPYKTHIAGVIATKRSGKPIAVPAAIYAHFGVDSVVAAGHYMMDATALARFRAAVVDDARAKELTSILAKLAKKGFTSESHESLKRVPKGFDPEHPRAELLKRKGLIVTFPKVPAGMLAKRELLTWLTKSAKDVAPLVQWLVLATA